MVEQEPDRQDRLLAAAKAGQPEALGALFDRYRNRLTALAAKEIGGPLQRKMGASDVVQETFLKAQAAILTFQGATEAEFAAWLQRILKHQCSNLNRHFQTQKRQMGRERETDRTKRDPLSVSFAEAGTGTPSKIVAKMEQVAQLESALRGLPTMYRRVIELRYWQHLSFPEIGSELGKSADAVRKLWLRAVARLNQELAKVSSDFPEP